MALQPLPSAAQVTYMVQSKDVEFDGPWVCAILVVLALLCIAGFAMMTRIAHVQDKEILRMRQEQGVMTTEKLSRILATASEGDLMLFEGILSKEMQRRKGTNEKGVWEVSLV